MLKKSTIVLVIFIISILFFISRLLIDDTNEKVKIENIFKAELQKETMIDNINVIANINNKDENFHVNELKAESEKIKKSVSISEITDYVDKTGKMPPVRWTLGLRGAPNEIYLTALFRGYGVESYGNKYAQERNVKFLTEMAESGDFAAQRQLIYITSPFNTDYLQQSLFNEYITEEAKVAIREQLSLNSEVMSLSSEERLALYQRALVVAAAYGKTDQISYAQELDGTKGVKSSYIGRYVAILDNDSYQRYISENDDGVIFEELDPKQKNEVMDKANKIYSNIVSLREKLNISNDSIVSESNATSKAKATICPTNTLLTLDDDNCII